MNPGNSPGTLVVDGSFLTGSGGRMLLEVESDGHSGWNTDHMIFTVGSALDLKDPDVTFRFLGNTDPLGFLASGALDVDTFFRSRTAGGDIAFDDSVFSGADFKARSDAYTITDFSFSAASGAQLQRCRDSRAPHLGAHARRNCGRDAVGAPARDPISA